MRVLVTGGAGFIGRRLIAALVQAGHSLVVLDNLDPKVHTSEPEDLNPEVTYVWKDVRDRDAVLEAAGGVDALVHLASLIDVAEGEQEIGPYVDVNVRGTAVLLDALQEVPSLRRIILTSSVAVYGQGSYTCPGDGHVRAVGRREDQLAAGKWEVSCDQCGRIVEARGTSEEEPPDPISVYGVTKLTQEKLFAAASKNRGIPAVILRFGNVFGPGQREGPYAGVVTTFLGRAEEGKPLLIHEDGRQTRDYLFVGDAVKAVRLALETRSEGLWIGNIGSGRPTSVRQVAEAVAKTTDSEPSLAMEGTYRRGDIRHLYLNVQRASQDLGFKATTRLEEGLRRILDRHEEA